MMFLGLALALALVGLNGFFVSVEFAVVAVRRTRMEQLAAEGKALAQRALKLVGDPDLAINAAQLGITIASLALGWIGEATVAAILEPPLESLIGRWSVTAAHSIGTAVAFALVTFLHIVLGEMVPKTVAIRYADTAAMTVALPMDWFMRFFRPLIYILNGSTALVLRLLGMPPISDLREVYTPDELKLILRQSQEGGAIEADQEQMLQKVFQFGNRQVNEVMIPRPLVTGVEAGATLQEFLSLFSTASHARFPVYEEEPENIVGVLAIKDVLRALAQEPTQTALPVREITRPALFVPETVAVSILLAEMRATHNQLAVVLDEYGGMAGIVTVEELIEEIVGRVSDELIAEEEPLIQVDELTVAIDAQLRVDEVNDELQISLPDSEQYETVAGFLLYRLQRVPAEGDLVRYADLELKIIQMKGPKIERVQIRRLI